MKKPRRHAAIQVPREYRMRILRALDVIAFDMGAREGAEHAPSAEVFLWLTEKLEARAERSIRLDYRPGLWLLDKEAHATPIEVIKQELGIV